ncbi:putative glucosylceramidase 4 [Rhipicephalus sanguineus]|uniref:putative glucosylceramidase 4 n=1 Tax=Rhipicephalus sanguineus TaxID=34632 RepID=UPI0020C1C3EA|nr:putative glucosylceramidase 4 [Rhipicephalus sanguineus]
MGLPKQLSVRTSQVKGYIAANNRSFTLAGVGELLDEAIALVTAENWARDCAHVVRLKEEAWEQDGAIESTLDSIIITLGSDSSSCSDSSVSELSDNDTLLLVVDSSRKYQEVFGFGGAFTDATGINIKSLPTNMQDDILKSYYSKEGLAYTIGRIPLASCDFSERKYTYDDTPGDLELKNFTLAPEDFEIKIPYMKTAMSLSSEPIWFFGSSWSSPSWMKTSNTLEGRGTLKGEPGGPYYKAWAKYYVRFLQEYERNGIPIWGLTTQNEPTVGFVPYFPWQALGFTPKTQRDFVKFDLGPALAEAGYGAEKLQVMIFDDNRVVLPHWANVVLGDAEAAKYVHGVAVHWYTDNFFGPWVLDKVHENFPDKFILATEACAGFMPFVKDKVILGSWERAEHYASDILEGERPLERERLWRALRRLAAGVTERLLLDAAEVLEVALELRELAPLGPRERLRPR